MDYELRNKVRDEQPLSLEETLRLDEALETQTAVGVFVGELSDGEPSLEWRSGLNNRLLATRTVKKRRTWFTWGSVGIATAAAATWIVMMPLGNKPSPPEPRRPVARQSNGSIEESLISAHREADLESGMGVSWTSEVSWSGPGS